MKGVAAKATDRSPISDATDTRRSKCKQILNLAALNETALNLSHGDEQ